MNVFTNSALAAASAGFEGSPYGECGEGRPRLGRQLVLRAASRGFRPHVIEAGTDGKVTLSTSAGRFVTSHSSASVDPQDPPRMCTGPGASFVRTTSISSAYRAYLQFAGSFG